MARKHIYDKDWRYDFLYPIVVWCIRHSYRRVEVHGEENIPTAGAQIACPNHCNTLMDPLAMLRAYNKMTCFGARSDIFRKKIFRGPLEFIRLVPLVRQRDGLRNVLQNNQTQEIIVEALEHDARFCLFPEGTHRTKHSLMGLAKGAMRIALAANEKFGDKKPVYLLPVGLEYGDYFRYRSTSLVNYGKPINVTEFLKVNEFENEAQAIDALRKELSNEMSKLITYIPFDENYDGKWALTKMCAIADSRNAYGDGCKKLYSYLVKNREIVQNIEDKLSEKPEKTLEILERSAKFEVKRRKAGISIFSFRKNNNVLATVFNAFTAILGIPYFIFSAITTLPMWALEMKIRNGAKDPAFRNTGSFGVKLGIGLILFPIYAILAFCLAPWWLALVLLLLWIPSYSFVHDYIEEARRWTSDIKLMFNKKLRKEFKSIIKDFNRL